MPRIGIIGGSGLYNIEGMQVKDELEVSTPFGKPSDSIVTGVLQEVECAFLPRHGRGHRINPSKINYRANIYALKKLGVESIISVSACGSLKENIKPLDFVIVDQFVDRTNQARPTTFFEDIVVHVSFADPICKELAGIIYQAAVDLKLNVYDKGTYLCMEGPAFSTRAESNLYRSWGMDVIGMTNVQEARLSREAEICYSSIAAVTDYDCWKEAEQEVTVDMVIANLLKNVENSKKLLKHAVGRLKTKKDCGCKHALKHALLTDPKVISAETKDKLKLLIGKYV